MFISACQRESAERSDALEDSTAMAVPLLLIDETGVGEFRLGEEIPMPPADRRLSISKEIVVVDAEGEQYEEPWYVVTMNGTELLRILPKDDPELEEYSTLIDEIRISSPECATRDSVRVGTTLEQLAGSFKTLTLWYTYVSNRFVADTPELPGVQFEIEGNGFIGARDDLSDTDIVFLARSDFRPNTRIHSIRILGDM